MDVGDDEADIDDKDEVGDDGEAVAIGSWK